MNADASETGQTVQNNAEELSRLLEIELIQKRAEWQRASARHKTVRSASLVLLLVIVLAALGACYFLFMRASEGRQPRSAETATSSPRP